MALTICTGQFEAMRQLQLFFFLSILCPTVQGQMHDNNWIFGYTFPSGNTDGTLLHFKNGFPEFTLENVGQDYFYYCILCSDSTGNLLFHTDGRQIRNKLHQIMDGGEIINPGQMWIDFYDGYPSVTGGLSIPAPGLENFYYIVHTTLKDGADPNILCPELLYSKIDMNANGGLGKVVEKNKVIANGDLPSPVIIKHGNGRDWWLVVGEYVSKTYLVYLIDKQGINLIHQLNIAPASLTNQSYAEASPDGTFFVSNDNITGLWVFDFDRCTGLLNNPRILPYQPQVFWTSTIAFSHDGRFLYLGTSLLVYQLDMQTIDNTEITIDTISRYEFGASPAPPHMTQFFLPELAPNNKIYFGTFNNSTAYHVINRPNLPLLASDMSQRGLLLPRHNMETRCYFPNYRLGKWLDSPCDSLATVPGSNVRFRDNQWTERNLGVSNDTVKILKLPTSFFIPAATDVFPEESFNPLNMNYLFRQQLAQKRSGKTEKLPSSSIKNE